MKIQSRLLLLMLFETSLTMIIALLITSYLIRQTLETTAKEKLAVVMEARYSALNHWVHTLQTGITILVASPITTQLLNNLSIEYAHLGQHAQLLLQQNYLNNKSNDPSATIATVLTNYNKIHSAAVPFFNNRRTVYDWYDIFLIDTQGNIVFSLKKENDFGTNLRTGAWQDSGLAHAVIPLLNNAIPKQLSFSDYTLYPPSDMQAASFLAMPVFDNEKQLFLGVVAIQLPITEMNNLMLNRSGMGETGETIVVNKDSWMLTDSRFIKENIILKKQIKTKAAAIVLARESTVLISPDYRGIESLIMVKPFLPFPMALGNKTCWGLIAKIEYTEVLHDYNTLQQVLLITTAVLILIALVLGIWGSHTITAPLLRITNALSGLANGEQISVPELQRTDEIGAIAKAAETFHSIVQQVEHEHWLSEHIMILSSAISMESSINKAADRVLHLLCDLLAVPVAAIYLLENKQYQRISSHGLARSNQADIYFDSGVGLLGQCAKSNQAIVLSPVPAGLTIISTGLAEFAPHELVIYPIEHKKEVLAVVELALTQSLSPKQHAFLKTASNTLGLHFANLQAAEHNSLLLAETRSQAAELRASSSYVRSLLEASLDPLITIATDGKIMDVNEATEKVTGLSRAELIGSDFSNYFTEPDKARIGYQQVFLRGFITDYALAIRHRAGSITEVLYNASVYRNDDGKVAGIFAAARDITDKKKAEQKIIEQQLLLNRNAEMLAITEELCSQSEEIKSQNEELKSSQEETLLKNQLLETQSNQLKAVLVETEMKTKELERVNQYKSEFLANMSHELRTPLNSILILSKSLAENEEHTLSTSQIESATVISESGTQLLSLINDILDLSKVEAGKLELVKESFTLQDMASYLQRVFTAQAVKKNLLLSIELASDITEAIYSDRQRLIQILSNLLSNAIKFTDIGSVKVFMRKIASDLQIEVSDTGIGIPADKLEPIFGAFQQLDGSTSRKYGGSGLGLAISRNLAHLLGGDIQVNSHIGQGSCFTLRLYKLFNTEAGINSVATTVTVTNPPIIMPDNHNILLVEDDTRLLAILGRMITALGFIAIMVESAEQALLKIAEIQLSGIFLDLSLPNMSGMELLRLLKAETTTAKIPIFIISGAIDTGEAVTLGALGFLKKPVTRDAIIESLKIMVQITQHFKQQRVLLIEDNALDKQFVENLLHDTAIQLLAVTTGAEALQQLQTSDFALVILDLQLPDISGFDWIKQAQTQLNLPPIIIYSARELTEHEVFELKGVTESIVTKDALSNRLREEVLHVLHCAARTALPLVCTALTTTNKKLLLVDDDARNLYALSNVLKSKGFMVEVAPDSISALELLTQNTFDVLLTDIMMPQVDGYELIRRVRALGYDKLPIIAITAKAMQGDDVLCLQAGANAYLAKPVDVYALIDLLNTL